MDHALVIDTIQKYFCRICLSRTWYLWTSAIRVINGDPTRFTIVLLGWRGKGCGVLLSPWRLLLIFSGVCLGKLLGYKLILIFTHWERFSHFPSVAHRLWVYSSWHITNYSWFDIYACIYSPLNQVILIWVWWLLTHLLGSCSTHRSFVLILNEIFVNKDSAIWNFTKNRFENIVLIGT